MIGSNMAQTAAMLGLTPNICLYDVYEPGLAGVTEEMRHCGFEDVNFTYTTDVKEALKGAKYIISSGGAPRKEGMTREDLLKGNATVAEQLGKDIKAYCPDVKHVVIIFNPADITGLVTLIWSGLKPSQVSTLAALDSIRLQSPRVGVVMASQEGGKLVFGFNATDSQFELQPQTFTWPLSPMDKIEIVQQNFLDLLAECQVENIRLLHDPIGENDELPTYSQAVKLPGHNPLYGDGGHS